MKQYITVLTLMLTIIGQDISGQSKSDCKDKLDAYILNMAEIKRPTLGKMHVFHFTVETQFKDWTGMTNSRANLKIVIGDKKYYYDSPQVSFFADEKETFVLLHSQGIILREEKGVELDRANDLQKMVAFQQSIIKQGTVSRCLTFTKEASTVQQISLEFSEEFSKTHQINLANYFFNLEKNQLHKVEVSFSKASKKLKQEIVYHQLLTNANNTIKGSARSVLFTANGQLRKHYRNYKLMQK